MRSFFSSVVLLAALVFSPPCSGAADEPILATHYTGEWWAPAFWSNIDLDDMDADFQRIKAAGFNTIILVVPWAGFQPTVSPVRWNENYFQLLKEIMVGAERHSLGVILRIGYGHEYGLNENIPAAGERKLAILTSPAVGEAWRCYLKKLNDVVADCRAFRFAFITWEDFTLLDCMLLPESERLALAAEIGFTDYLRQYPLAELSAAFGRKFSAWSDIPVPASATPESELFLRFWDEYLLRLFALSNDLFPHLSMEVRVDCDPVKDAGFRCHQQTFDFGKKETITTLYYTAAWGAQNVGDHAGADDAAARFDYLLTTVRKATDNPLFIDQLNFIDNTPGFEKNTKIKEQEIPLFLEKITPMLAHRTIGYGLWGMDDIVGNILVNSSFERGTKGWEITAGEHIVKQGDRHSRAILLKSEGSLSQKFFFRSASSVIVEKGELDVSFTVRAPKGDAEVEVLLADTDGRVVSRRTIPVSSTAEEHFRTEKMTFVVQGTLIVRNVSARPIVIDTLKLSYFTQRTGIYDENGTPRPWRDAVVEMNRRLAAPSAQPGSGVPGPEAEREITDDNRPPAN